jgi:hypothetical protein
MSVRRIRMLLVAGLLLPAALVFTPAKAQFPRPPIPPGGMAGRPGGIGGMPAGINGGMPGGINGGIAGRPGGIGGINGGIAGGPGGVGGMPGQHEWVCGGCGKVLGVGPVKPIMASCPFCGVKFTNGMDFEMSRPGGGPPIGGPPMGGPPMGAMGGPPMGGPNIPPTEPAHPNPPPFNPPDAGAANNNNNNVPAPVAGNQAAANSGSSSTGRTVLIVGAIGCGVLFLVAALGTFLYISATRSSKDDRPKRRRKRVYHDEDD